MNEGLWDEYQEGTRQDDMLLPTNNPDGKYQELIFQMKNLTFSAATVSPYFAGNFKIHPDAKAQGDIAYMSFIDHINIFSKMHRLQGDDEA
ncbi:MAG: hypothetical protein QS748_11015 [Candidatus Endonucleobacter bathymodioli]|uniref:Uncharacterized protein n=1 Tax=Candidatus Endonucleibacter bathymodioli TaxID=539814 RepID=A0AA90SDT3_9GAMM|nr:hypothetical protein [Candidatus Endonucleobacter bathymodioli]